MKSETNETLRGQKLKLRRLQEEGPNWVFIVGGALLSTLSIRIGWGLMQFLGRNQLDNTSDNLTGNKRLGAKKRPGSHALPRNIHIGQDGNNLYNCLTADGVEIKRATSCPILDEEPSLPVVMIPMVESGKYNNGAMWTSSPNRLELPRRPIQHSNSSDSPRPSESGSDIFTKRDVIHKLRKQLKRREETIMEMQAQMRNLQNSLNSQMAHSAHLQSLLDSANKDMLDSEREIQWTLKAIADHCVTEITSPKKTASCPEWHPETKRYSNGYVDSINVLDLHCIGVEKDDRDGERVEMLKREVQELKKVIEGKEFLLQSYKEQKTELTTTVKELQQRLTYQVPNIL